MKMTPLSLLLCSALLVPGGVFAQNQPAAPAAEAPKEEDLGPFASVEEKRAYALGMFFGQRAKQALEAEEAMDLEQLLKGLESVLKTESTKSFDYGAFVGLDLKRNNIEVETAGVLSGVQGAVEEAAKLTEEQMNEVMNDLRQEMQAKAMEKRQKEQEAWQKKQAEMAPKNEAAGKKFLAENKGEEGVVTTDSGLQYKVLSKGESEEKPGPTDRVSVIYKGELLDGTVFDDSQGKPRTFAVNRVVKGWTEGLQLMTKGSKVKLWIPGELGYGMTPRKGGEIKAMDTLVFDVELVDITKAPVVATPPVAVRPGIPGGATTPRRKPITAVTPPVAVEIPPRKKPEGEEKKQGEEK
ncbi:MAG: FKBP-type peptidyl-prolyl cis-trans isomerase N-terminal domain-containing protein [Verrucomicrobiales bacterium]|nr:FKBP-type peptidyl-prolyl cis-trans isomerase N-terminal domain-containing protein [Verrucomicrobiales bacterium]